MLLTEQETSWAKILLGKIDFLSGVSPEDISELVASLEKKYYKAGQTILFQGELANTLHLIHTGKVSVTVSSKGERKKVAELAVGNYFGEISLIEPTSAKATIRSEEPTLVYTISSDSFYNVINRNPGALEFIKQKIEERKQTLENAKAK
jgi:signal-transduction protein with cAMP-binding, CBS, and nucleotidyltransferase domain